MHRRQLIQGAAAATLLTRLPLAGAADKLIPGPDQRAHLDEYFPAIMAERHIPGLTACLVYGDKVAWQQSYGFADLEKREAMTPDHIQNIASISKTFTTLAALQQVEAGLMDLDQDVNAYLPYSLRNPRHPQDAITVRMLMHHSSSVLDGTAYGGQYACGDPRMSLGTWIREFASPDGRFFSAEHNFGDWAPGASYSYSNTAFGLLGHLVEITSGLDFQVYCQRNIFTPLGLNNTGWMLAGVDRSKHLTPYTWAENGLARGPSWDGSPLGVISPDGPTGDAPVPDGYNANCMYNHPNYPDGFLRTSPPQLVQWARLWMNGGRVDNTRLLGTETVQAAFTEGAPGQGLTWYVADTIDGQKIWGHGGSDPGVNTALLMAREQKVAAIVFTNTNDIEPKILAMEVLKMGLQDLA